MQQYTFIQQTKQRKNSNAENNWTVLLHTKNNTRRH